MRSISEPSDSGVLFAVLGIGLAVIVSGAVSHCRPLADCSIARDGGVPDCVELGRSDTADAVQEAHEWPTSEFQRAEMQAA